MKNAAFCLIVLLVLLPAHALAQQSQTVPGASATPPATTRSPEINTLLMESTFLVKGPSAKVGEEDKERTGTCFIMARRLKADSDEGVYVLITAKHVFEDIRGDQATVVLRKRNTIGDPIPLPFLLKIRDRGRKLYTEHASADVAAIDVDLPSESIMAQLEGNIATPNWFATDDFLKDIAIHPGDELLSLGYPFGLQANDAGYAVLRSGKIASYPIIPQKRVPPILYDFRVLPGNSGGPVYFEYADRLYKGTYSPFKRVTFQKIFGLVTSMVNPIQNTDPSIGLIVPSVFIKETIDQLAGFESKITEEPVLENLKK